jgi:hypothetical protein
MGSQSSSYLNSKYLWFVSRQGAPLDTGTDVTHVLPLDVFFTADWSQKTTKIMTLSYLRFLPQPDRRV